MAVLLSIYMYTYIFIYIYILQSLIHLISPSVCRVPYALGFSGFLLLQKNNLQLETSIKARGERKEDFDKKASTDLNFFWYHSGICKESK